MRFINKTSDLSKYLGIRIENQALIKYFNWYAKNKKRFAIYSDKG